MNKFLTTAALLIAMGATPAYPRLQLSIGVGASTFTCFDGQLSCDVSGGANNLLVIDQTVGNAFVQITLAQSTFGARNSLQLSSSAITNEGLTPITVKLLASDTGFLPPVSFIRDSASLTFNDAVGSGPSMLQFWADHGDLQGANPTNTPGALLETVFGTPLTDPDSFSGSNLAAFINGSPFSMTEGASLALRGSASITGFNQSMTSGIPEPKTWAMAIIGFGLMALMGLKRARKDRLEAAF
jgi:hypothetical protein